MHGEWLDQINQIEEILKTPWGEFRVWIFQDYFDKDGEKVTAWCCLSVNFFLYSHANSIKGAKRNFRTLLDNHFEICGKLNKDYLVDLRTRIEYARRRI